MSALQCPYDKDQKPSSGSEGLLRTLLDSLGAAPGSLSLVPSATFQFPKHTDSFLLPEGTEPFSQHHSFVSRSYLSSSQMSIPQGPPTCWAPEIQAALMAPPVFLHCTCTKHDDLSDFCVPWEAVSSKDRDHCAHVRLLPTQHTGSSPHGRVRAGVRLHDLQGAYLVFRVLKMGSETNTYLALASNDHADRGDTCLRVLPNQTTPCLPIHPSKPSECPGHAGSREMGQTGCSLIPPAASSVCPSFQPLLGEGPSLLKHNLLFETFLGPSDQTYPTSPTQSFWKGSNYISFALWNLGYHFPSPRANRKLAQALPRHSRAVVLFRGTLETCGGVWGDSPSF